MKIKRLIALAGEDLGLVLPTPSTDDWVIGLHSLMDRPFLTLQWEKLVSMSAWEKSDGSLRDAYRLPGLVALAEVRAIFGDPQSEWCHCVGTEKKESALSVALDTAVTTIDDRGRRGICRALRCRFTWSWRCLIPPWSMPTWIGWCITPTASSLKANRCASFGKMKIKVRQSQARLFGRAGESVTRSDRRQREQEFESPLPPLTARPNRRRDDDLGLKAESSSLAGAPNERKNRGETLTPVGPLHDSLRASLRSEHRDGARCGVEECRFHLNPHEEIKLESRA